jgi:hypothetical protein
MKVLYLKDNCDILLINTVRDVAYLKRNQTCKHPRSPLCSRMRVLECLGL